MQPEEAESVAIRALVHIGEDPELLRRFLAVTGIESQDIREAAREAGFLGGVLDFVLAHEPTLNQFCDKTGVDPAEVAAARTTLSPDPAPPPDD